MAIETDTLTIPEAAEYAGVGIDAIRHAIARMRVRSSVVDGRRVIAQEDLERWMATRPTMDQQRGWRGQRHVPGTVS